MRPIWKGAISFGLVNIPVSLFTGTKSAERIDFDMLRASDLSRIRYKRVSEADQKEVPYEQIVKGYQYEKGNYVVVTKEDLERVASSRRRSSTSSNSWTWPISTRAISMSRT